MSQVCWYFQLHQPWRLRPYSIFSIGNEHDYFLIDNELEFANERVFRKVVEKSYAPMLHLLAELLEQQSEFRFTLSLSGVVLEQFKAFAPEKTSKQDRSGQTLVRGTD